MFYEKALEKSKDVFKVHTKYDQFIENIGEDYPLFISKSPVWINNNFEKYRDTLDKDIEKRARHYTSNLVKIGFTDSDRNITDSGYAYLKGSITRDYIEELLPLDNTNISLLRQLSKLRVFSKEDESGRRTYYSPFFMAIALLLDDKVIDEHTFEIIVQGLTPYTDDNIKDNIINNTCSIDELLKSILKRKVEVPFGFDEIDDLPYEVFKTYFRSSKSNETTSRKYYNFFTALKNFRENQTEDNYNKLIECFDNNNEMICKAFGYGKAIFNIGSRGNRHCLSEFLKKNKDNNLLTCKNYLSEMYTVFSVSKWTDVVREYSDTTIRLLSATGLFKFKNLPELAYKDILKIIFSVEDIRKLIFGEVSEEEYKEYEEISDCKFGKTTPLSEIFDFKDIEIEEKVEKIEKFLDVKSSKDVKNMLNDERNLNFRKHVEEKYSKEKIMQLLPLFSDRSNDRLIKNSVNDTADIPTIYEYIVGIAWYYISNKDFNLYNSLNLTLNADFEPVIHAGGGEGDIVIDYSDSAIMLEVTLMNKQAQKRGEWEPVLRHSLNLKAEKEPKETVTFFIADELDYNTINIWRAVSAVKLESTNTHQMVDSVIIMPFTNNDLLCFLSNDISSVDIITQTKKSFETIPKIKDIEWRENIISTLTK